MVTRGTTVPLGGCGAAVYTAGMISLSALAALHSEYADDLARTVEPVSVGGVTIGGSEPVLMGTVNLSRDSTYRESIAVSTEAAIRMARTQVAQGAPIVDLGAESSNAGTTRVDAADQQATLLPVVEALAGECVVSVETYQPEVVEVGLRDEQRDIRVHAVVPGVRHHVLSRGGERLLDRPGDVGVERAEHDRAGERRGALLDRHAGDALRDRDLLPPADDLPVALARAGGGRGHGGDLEPGMVGEEADELLAHRAGGAQHGDRDLCCHDASRARRSVASLT